MEYHTVLWRLHLHPWRTYSCIKPQRKSLYVLKTEVELNTISDHDTLKL